MEHTLGLVLISIAWVGACSGCGGVVSSGAPGDSSVADSSTSDSGISDSPTPTDGAPPDVGFDKACSSAGMCVLVPASCCGSCGVATLTDRIAIPRDKAVEYRKLACTTDGGTMGCPECAGLADPNLQAFCRGGICVPVVVTTDDVSACSSDAECMLVQGVCCGPCDGERTLVAIAKSKGGEFSSQICDPRADCAGCPLPSPLKSSVRCDPTTKHCVVVKPA